MATKLLKRAKLQKLLEWYKSEHRKPLILYGARQVGKTTLVQHFAQQHVKRFYYFNLEDIQVQREFQHIRTVRDFLRFIEAKTGKTPPQNALFFFDEVQNNLNVLKLLRFFKEDYPQYAVIVTGSWLNLYIQKVLKQGEFSSPVGRVAFMTLHPLSFLEYLSNKNQLAYQRLVEDPLNVQESIHSLYLQEFYNYMLLGGMPEVVSTCNLEACEQASDIHRHILNTIANDLHKYLPTNYDKALQVFEAIFRNPAQGWTKSKLLPNTNARTTQKILDALHYSFLITPVYKTIATQLPLTQSPKNATKYLSLDIGLSMTMSGVFKQQFVLVNSGERFLANLEDSHKGHLAEQVVGQLLLTTFFNEYTPFIDALYYWTNKKGDAEIDFLVNYGGKLLGIEVKSGKAGKLRSLITFLNKSEHSVGVRIYAGPFKVEKISLTSKPIISVPFYMIELIPRILEDLGLLWTRRHMI